MPKLILGHTTDQSIKLWVRGSVRWPVAFIRVYDTSGRAVRNARVLELSEDEFYTGVITWDALRPSRHYEVKVSFGKSSESPESEWIRDAYTHGRFKTFPSANSASKLSFLLGSCNLHSLGIIKNPDDVWLRVSELAKQNQSDFMIHCGDQIYADIPFTPSASPSFFRNKYLDAWDDCVPMKKYLTEVPHYMMLDDHEIINNFHRDMSSRHTDFESLQRVAMKVYYEFQHKHNPETQHSPREYSYEFSHGRHHFFAMDTRTWRSQEEGIMINQEQLDRFKFWLISHQNQIKFVISSVPFVAESHNPRGDKWSDPIYKQQREEIITFIIQNNIKKVVFLCGDMHHSYHAKMTVSDGSRELVVHELMSSPLNQFTPDEEMENVYRQAKMISLSNGVSYRSRVTPSSFYARHSSVMLIDVNGTDVRWRVYRTRKSARVAKRGSFTLN